MTKENMYWDDSGKIFSILNSSLQLAKALLPEYGQSCPEN